MRPRDSSMTRRHLRDAPDSGLSGETSAEERIALAAILTAEAWALAGLELPSYSRSETPITQRPLRGAPESRHP